MASRLSMILDERGKPFDRPNGKPRPHLVEHLARRPRVVAEYDAAQTHDDSKNYWAASDAYDADSANSRGVREKLVQRSRYDIWNNGFSDGIAQTWTTDLIGKGPALRMQTGSERFNQMVEMSWFYWCQAIKFRRKLWCMAHATVSDGEGIAVIRKNPNVKHQIKLDLRLYETEQCQTPTLGYSESNYIDGIKFDQFGDPEWYDIMHTHPGSSDYHRMDLTPERVRAQFVLHWFKMRRPGQHRGIPLTTSTLNTGAAARRWREATLAAAETAADFAVLLETQFEPEEMDRAEAFSTLEIQKRMMTALPNSMKASQLRAEHPNATFDTFHRSLINEQARPLSMPFNKAACDSASYNYASGRLDHQTYYASLDVEREDCNDLVLEPLFNVWFDYAITSYGWLGGNPEAVSSAAKAHQWDWPKHRVADVATEAEANDKQLKNGSKSLSAIYSEAGQDYEDEAAKQAASNGITVDQQKILNLLVNLPQHIIPAAERLLGIAPEPEPPTPEPEPQADASHTTVIVNAYDPDQPRSDDGKFGSGGGSSSSERPRDRYEGTQKEADREVSRANANVQNAQTALSKAEAKATDKKAVVNKLQTKLTSVQQKIADLEAQKAASQARIAALRSQLKGELKASVETDLDKEILKLDKIAKQLSNAADEADAIATEASKLIN